jgi:hypothetical protein
MDALTLSKESAPHPATYGSASQGRSPTCKPFGRFDEWVGGSLRPDAANQARIETIGFHVSQKSSPQPDHGANSASSRRISIPLCKSRLRSPSPRAQRETPEPDAATQQQHLRKADCPPLPRSMLDLCLIPAVPRTRLRTQKSQLAGISEMEPTGIEPVTSCLQRIPWDTWERTRNPRVCRDFLPRLGAYVPRVTAGIYPYFPGSARMFRH